MSKGFYSKSYIILNPGHVLATQKEVEKGRNALRQGYLLGHGRYPCVARGARGRLQGGNVGRNLGAERVIHIIGVGGGDHFGWVG